jgi:hypothetical protein
LALPWFDSLRFTPRNSVAIERGISSYFSASKSGFGWFDLRLDVSQNPMLR